MPVLKHVMAPLVCTHYALLVSAMALLTKDVVKVEDIDLAEKMLLDFCQLFPDIYGNHNIMNCSFFNTTAVIK